MNDDRDDISGIEPLTDDESTLNTQTDLTTGDMDKMEFHSLDSKDTDSDATLTSGYVSRSFPSLASMSKSLSLSPEQKQETSMFDRYSAIHRSAGMARTDRENADRYRRPVGVGPRVQLFAEAGDAQKVQSDDKVNIVKKPKGLVRSLSSPPPGSSDGTSTCYFSRDKFFKLTPEVEPLITNDMNNNDGEVNLKASSHDNSKITHTNVASDVQDFRGIMSSELSSNSANQHDQVSFRDEDTSKVPPLSMEQLLNISSVSETDGHIEDKEDHDDSYESLDFQQEQDQAEKSYRDKFHTDYENAADDRVPRSLYKDDDSLMEELVMDHAFKLTLGTSPSSSDDEESQPCPMPPMDLQPVVYNDLEKTFTESTSEVGYKEPENTHISQVHEQKSGVNPELTELTERTLNDMKGSKQFQDKKFQNEQNPNQQYVPESHQQVQPKMHEMIDKLPLEVNPVHRTVEFGNEEVEKQRQIPQGDYLQMKNINNNNLPTGKSDKDLVSSSMATSQSSNVTSECSSSMHGPALDPMATHDLSISSSIYSYLAKAGRPQEIVSNASNMKTSSPMVNRTQIKELLQKGNKEIDSIEPLRDHVRDVLRLTETVLPDKNPYDYSEDDLLGGYHSNTDLSILSDLNIPRVRNSSFMPGSYLETLGMRSGFMFDQQNRSDATNSSAVLVENQTLKDVLEKERFRRKHVEKQIAACQSHILELQEQLAVAVSMGRKKDGMIEQLDKALAKVASGWKKRDAESKELVKQLQTENEALNTRGQHQQEMAAKLERELSLMVEKLQQEQQRAAQVQEETEQQMKEQQEELSQNIEKLKAAEDRLRTITDERDVLNAAKNRLQGQLLDLRQALDSERESWEDKEKEYLQKIDEITANHLKSVDQEKRKSALAIQTLEETEGVLSTVQNEMSRLGMQLDAVNREKESMKVEMGIQEARHESSRRKLEADLRGDYEKQMSQKLSESHKRQSKSEEEMRERHRRQVSELNARHAQEIEEMNKKFREEVQDKEDKMRQQGQEYDEKLSDLEKEREKLMSEVKSLEGQRQEMTHSLQDLMHAHCSEALRLLKIGTVSSSATQSVTLTTSMPHEGSKFGKNGQSISMATTETSWSMPMVVSSTMAKNSVLQGTNESSVWNNSALSHLSTSGLLQEEQHRESAEKRDRSHGQISNSSDRRLTSYSHAHDDPQQPFASQAPPSSWFPSQAPPTLLPQAPPTSKATPTSDPHQSSNSELYPPFSYFSSFLTQPQNSTFRNDTKDSQESKYNDSFLQQSLSSSKPFESQPPSFSGFSSLIDYGAQLALKYSQSPAYQSQASFGQAPPTFEQAPPTFQDGPQTFDKAQPTFYQAPPTFEPAPPTFVQDPPIMFHSSLNSADHASVTSGVKSFEYQAPPSAQHSQESFAQNPAHHQINLSFREDATGSFIQDHTKSQSEQSRQTLSPMYTSSPPRGRGYGSKPLPQSSGSSQGSNFLRQLVESVEEDEFQVLREDTTIESNTEDTESHASPKKMEDVRMDKEMPSQGDISDISERFHEHQNRQAELQHYIKMLLQRSPGSDPASSSSAQRSFQDEEPTRDVSHGNAYSPIRIPQPDPVIVSGQGQEVMRSSFENRSTTAADLPPVSGLSPKQVGEIAKLIGQYRTKPLGSQQPAHNPSGVESAHLRNLHLGEESTSSSERSPPRTVIPKKLTVLSKEPLTKEKVRKNLGVTFTEASKELLLKQEATTKQTMGKQHQGAAPASRGQQKKPSVKVKTTEDKKIVKDKKVAKVWK